MNYESRAIALLNHKYGDGAVIAKIFTEEYGLKSFSIKRTKSKKSKNKIVLLDKLSLLAINAKDNPKKEIQYLSEINLAYAYQNISLKNKLIRMFIATNGCYTTSSIFVDQPSRFKTIIMQNTLYFP